MPAEQRRRQLPRTLALLLVAAAVSAIFLFAHVVPTVDAASTCAATSGIQVSALTALIFSWHKNSTALCSSDLRALELCDKLSVTKWQQDALNQWRILICWWPTASLISFMSKSIRECGTTFVAGV